MQENISIPSDFRMTPDFESALKLMNEKTGNVYITGDAGSGKSTLLHYFREQAEVTIAVVAPTGIAAVNVGGQTIHSFFGLPLGVVAKGNIKVTNKRKDILKHVHTIVIDEISMVRADIMDAIDESLRQHLGKDEPFGGKKVIMFGDPAQLPPVVRREDREILNSMGYPGEYFFDSKVIRELGDRLICVRLTEVFRQRDELFLGILNRMRTNSMTSTDLATINSRVGKKPSSGTNAISLTGTNDAARDINITNLNGLHAKKHRIVAEVSGDFDIAQAPTDEILELKSGAQIMMVRNDSPFTSRWQNGTVGIVESYKAGVLKVKIGDEVHDVERAEWKRIQYTYDPSLQAVEEEELGSFTQFPVKLAWAITIHKCVSSDTRIPTSLGLIKISDFEKTMPESVAGIRSSQSVSELFDSGRELGYKITTRKGYEIVCSERHPLLAVRQGERVWAKSPDLAVGDFLRMRVGTNSFGSGIFNYPKKNANNLRKYHAIPCLMTGDLAWALGALVGDGCVSDKRDARIDITCEDKEVIDGFVKACGEIFGIATTTKKHNDRNAFISYAHNKGVREFLEFIGLGYETASNKKIPESIFTSSISCQAAFLRGLFDTDGGASKSEIHLTTTSEVLAKEVQILLANLGIISSRRDQNDGENWRVGVTGRQTASYMRVVGFTIPRKIEAGNLLVARTMRSSVPKVDNGGIPNSREIAEKMRSELNIHHVRLFSDDRHYLVSKRPGYCI